MKVTVSAGLPPVNVALQGLVVPVHVELARLFPALQPAKVEPTPALAVNVTVGVLSEKVILGAHVLVTVCEAIAVPVPPHETGALTVPVLGVIVTEPPPLPAKVRFMFLASVNVVRACEAPPTAVK